MMTHLKTELASVERKMQLSITQNEDNDGKEDVIEDLAVLFKTVKSTKTGMWM